MGEKFSEYIKDEKIQAINHEEDFITIEFENEYKCIKLFAAQDCCSESWFETLNESFDSIIGKEIKSIKTEGELEMTSSGRQECDTNKLIVIEFQDSIKFEFVLRNSSNGYYNGWLEIKII